MAHEFIAACKKNDLNKIQQMIHMIDMPLNEGFISACGYGQINHMYLNEGFISACGYGHINVVKYLVSLGVVDIHARDEAGFRWACQNRHIDVVKYLVSLGVDIHAREEEGFRWACCNGHSNVVRYLVPLGVDSHASCKEGFIWACHNGHIDVIRYLVNFMQCVKYRKLNKISQFMPSTDTDYLWTRKNTYLINVGKYMNHLNNNFIL